MGKHINGTFEVEVQLESQPEYVPRLLIEADFVLTLEGPAHLQLHLISEVTAPGYNPHSLVFTTHEMAQIRFAVADAIEQRYLNGEYAVAS